MYLTFDLFLRFLVEAFLSIREIAKEANVNEASIARLSQSLGFRSSKAQKPILFYLNDMFKVYGDRSVVIYDPRMEKK